MPAWHTNTIAGSSEAPYSPTSGTVIGTPAGLLINIGGKTSTTPATPACSAT